MATSRPRGLQAPREVHRLLARARPASRFDGFDLPLLGQPAGVVTATYLLGRPWPGPVRTWQWFAFEEALDSSWP